MLSASFEARRFQNEACRACLERSWLHPVSQKMLVRVAYSVFLLSFFQRVGERCGVRHEIPLMPRRYNRERWLLRTTVSPALTLVFISQPFVFLVGFDHSDCGWIDQDDPLPCCQTCLGSRSPPDRDVLPGVDNELEDPLLGRTHDLCPKCQLEQQDTYPGRERADDRGFPLSVPEYSERRFISLHGWRIRVIGVEVSSR